MSYVLSITIGRNVPNTVIDDETGTPCAGDQAVPMSNALWNEFRTIIRRSLRHQAEHQDVTHASAYFIEEHVGTGVWNGETEESAKISVVSEHEVTLSPDALNGLAYVAAQFGQQAVAVTKGESFLVEAK